MPSRPQVSFAVLNYNNGRFLRDCLDSILRQNGGHDFEIILVDDASTDNSHEIALSYTDPRIRYIRHARNQGHIATVNDAVGQASGDYIARVDSDDRYRPDFLNEVLPVFAHHPEVGLVYGDAAVMDDQGQINIERSDRAHAGRDFKGNELVRLLEENFICSPTVIARREAWQETLPAPEGLAFHDWYFTTMIARSWDFYYLHKVVADYRVHSGNWHTVIVRNRQEEPSIFALLNRIYAETEIDPQRERAKRAARRRVYGRHYLTLADKYFGAYLNEDARRCYLQAVRNRPSYLLRFGIQRRLLATIAGREGYETGKRAFKALLQRS
jgi:glycosyltransferase involved in cell wall biosynthesis